MSNRSDHTVGCSLLIGTRCIYLSFPAVGRALAQSRWGAVIFTFTHSGFAPATAAITAASVYTSPRL
eukprot:2315006-Prymnesium_polylepis.1